MFNQNNYPRYYKLIHKNSGKAVEGSDLYEVAQAAGLGIGSVLDLHLEIIEEILNWKKDS